MSAKAGIFVLFPASMALPHIQKAFKIYISRINLLYIYTHHVVKSVKFINVLFLLLLRKYKHPRLYFQYSIFCFIVAWYLSLILFCLYFYLYIYLIFTPILKPESPIFISCLFISYHQIVHKCISMSNCKARFILFSLHS